MIKFILVIKSLYISDIQPEMKVVTSILIDAFLYKIIDFGIQITKRFNLFFGFFNR